MRAMVVASALLLAACGGAVTRPDASPADARTDAGNGCPASVVPGGTCAPGTPVCLGDDRCNDCFCTAGAWVCGTRVCVRDAGTCPAGRPRTGDACSAPRQVCDYGTGCGSAHCVCAGVAWTCDTAPCPDR